MVDIITSTENQTHSEIESDDQQAAQSPEEMLTTGEHTLYEIRPLLWPYLARPSLWIIIGIVIAVYSQRIPLDFLRDFEEFVSLALITSIIRWLGIGVLCVGVLGVIIRCLRWRFTAYTVTNLRILRQTGILAKSYVDCSLSKVQTLYLEIPIMGRILNFGTIRVATAGTNSSEIHWERVRNPKNTHRILSETIEQYRRQGTSALS
jgi:uncharacterized membrane protein YdbT with pleckstrin-like domain